MQSRSPVFTGLSCRPMSLQADSAVRSKDAPQCGFLVAGDYSMERDSERVNIDIRRKAAVAFLAALLASCNAANPSALLPTASTSLDESPARSAPRVHRGRGRLVVRIRIPRESRPERGRHYISADTKGMTMAFTGPSSVTQVIARTPSDPRCAGTPLSCTFGIDLPSGTYTSNVNT